MELRFSIKYLGYEFSLQILYDCAMKKEKPVYKSIFFIKMSTAKGSYNISTL